MSTAGNRAPLPLRELAAPLAVIGFVGAGFVSMAVCWVASTAAADAPAAAPGFGTAALRALTSAAAQGSLDPLIGAAGSRPVFWTVIAALVAPVLLVGVAGAIWAAVRGAGAGSAAASMAGRREMREMRGGRAARARALQLRPSLRAQKAIEDRDLGLLLGRHGSRKVYASEEDVVLEIAGPRSNKTSAQVVPAILSAPGPVITTSNKVDVYTLTIGLRAELGRTFVADPQAIAGVEQNWWWNPLADIADMSDAGQLVTHFSATVGAGSDRADPYFTKGAERLLAQLVLAAARTPGRSLRDVRAWLATRDDEPVRLLSDRGMVDVASGLQGTLEAPPEQRGGLFETALTAISSLESEAVARYITPPDTWQNRSRVPVEEFDPWRFLVGYQRGSDDRPVPRDTLYLLTREGAGSGAPVVAAMVDHLLRVAAKAATAQGGRVDPPLRPVLDEAANICPIRNLPDLYSYFGSMSIQVMTFLQSYQQGVALWGKAGMDKLWSASTIKLIGAGVQDPEFTEHLSRLVGQHDVPTWSHQHGRGGSSSTASTRRDPILSAADVAALSKRHAILFSAGRRPALLNLMPWYDEGDADTISAHAAEASDQVRRSAIAALGPRNPLAQVLAARTADADRASDAARAESGSSWGGPS